MSRRFSARALALACSLLCLGVAAPVAAQDFPSRQIKIIVTFAAGSGSDVVTRLIGAELQNRLGQPVVIENQTGGGTVIATQNTARAEPDGYTLLMTTSGHTILPAIHKTLPFDAIKDFTPVMMVCAGPLILVTHPQYPAKNLKELIAMAKEKPGSINFASAGTGSAPHMALELLKFKTGTDIVHVPYRGGPPAMADVISGVVQAYFAASATALTQLQGGTVRAIAQTTGKRSQTFKDIPTIAEQDVPDFDLAQWYGLVAPAKLPPEIAEKIRKEVTDIMGKDDIRKKMLGLGCEPQPSTSAEFAKYIGSEVKLWTEIAKEAKLGN